MPETWTKRVVTDVRVEIDLPAPRFFEIELIMRRHGIDWMEAKARLLEAKAKELEEFLRDHRHRDNYSLTVIREKREFCKFCGREAKMDEDGPYCCDEAVKAWTFGVGEKGV